MHDILCRASLFVRKHRTEIVETIGDAIGAASLMGLLVVLSFFGLVFG